MMKSGGKQVDLSQNRACAIEWWFVRPNRVVQMEFMEFPVLCDRMPSVVRSHKMDFWDRMPQNWKTTAQGLMFDSTAFVRPHNFLSSTAQKLCARLVLLVRPNRAAKETWAKETPFDRTGFYVRSHRTKEMIFAVFARTGLHLVEQSHLRSVAQWVRATESLRGLLFFELWLLFEETYK